MNPSGDHHHHRPPPPPHPHRPSFSCDLHPSEKFNGFCPSCLYDRLTTLHPDTAASSLFRRTKSFSASHPDSSGFVPHRRSCDVRVPREAGVLGNVGRGIGGFGGNVGGRAPIEGLIEVGGAQNVGCESGDFGGTVRVRAPIEGQIEVGRAQNVGCESGDLGRKSRVRAPIEEKSRVTVPVEAGGARTKDHNAGEEIGDFGGKVRVRAPIEGPIETGRARFGEKVGVTVPIEESGAQTLNHNVGEEIKVPTEAAVPKNEIGGFGGNVRVVVPIEAGGARTLAHNVGEEIRKFGGKVKVGVSIEAGGLGNETGDFKGKSRIRVPIEASGAQSLAHNMGDEIRDFGKPIRVRIPKEGPIASIREKSRFRVPNEAGRGRALGCNVGDKIKVFEEQISPTEAEIAQTLAQNVGSENRPFKEKVKAINHNVGDEIMVLEEQIAQSEEQSRVRVPIEAGRAQTLAHDAGDETRVFEEEETKRMRDHIDLDFPSKKKKPSVGFWSAASVFSKKWSKWMKKQKGKKQEKTVLPLDRHRETQSEVADYGLGRRSCDTEPRFSIDIGRLSIDGPRPSFDPPRASWDGHMARRSNFSDHRFPNVETIPGDTIQTHQYYLDTSSRRRRSFDRSGLKNSSSSVIGPEVDELRLGSNAKVTPETFDFHKRKSNSNSLRDECSEIFELGIRDDGSIIGNVEEKGSKRSGRWGKKWSFWGLIYKRNKYNEDDRSSSVKGNIRGSTSGDTYRRSSSASLTSSYNMSGLSGSVRNKGVGENGRKKRDELVLDRNRSVDNGLLRFYLTPPRSKSRGFGSRKSSETNNSRSILKGVYRY